jgi:protein-S-isoprenylcysteine O-methyltransferase Ste14
MKQMERWLMMKSENTDYKMAVLPLLLFILGGMALFFSLMWIFSATGYIAAKLAVAGGSLWTEIANIPYLLGLVLFVVGLLLLSLGIIGLNNFLQS